MEYIQVIEELSNSENLRHGDILKFSKELLKIAADTLGCQRTNAWLFNADQTVLQSINAYDAKHSKFSREGSLNRDDLPNYFRHLTQNKIIVSNDASASELNQELIASYILPNQITSMIDVPLRSEGDMIGVICFEYVKKRYVWTESDQKFTQSLAQLFSLAIETSQKKIYHRELEKSIHQKEILLYEINHRVKNNMAIIIGLINLQRTKAKDQYHEEILDELKNKIYSMAVVQNHLHNNKSLVRVELSQYLNEIIYNLNDLYNPNRKISLKTDLDKAVIDISQGIPIGLIANEILTNSFKYAFNGNGKNHQLSVLVKRKKGKVEMRFTDNGPAYDAKDINEGMGMGLIRDLTDQIKGSLEIKLNGGVDIKIEFPVQLSQKE